jgi:hypothetical protein
LGFTAANGEPLLCATAKGMKNEWITGVDLLAEWNNFEENCGDTKVYLFSPSCIFKGKEVPTFAASLKVGASLGIFLQKFSVTSL